MNIVEQLVEAKSRDGRESEDAIFFSPAYAAVIDGATDKTGRPFADLPGGLFAARSILRTIARLDPGLDIRAFVDGLAQGLLQDIARAAPGFDPRAELLAANRDRVRIVRDPREAVRDVDLVATDVWASMGHERELNKRSARFAGFQVNRELMSLAAADALFMHCLPAHRGEEVSAEVLDAPDSVVWDEAENRLHAQKALLEFLCPPT